MPAEWILALILAGAGGRLLVIWLGVRRISRRRHGAGPVGSAHTPVRPDKRVAFVPTGEERAAEARAQVEAASSAAGWSLAVLGNHPGGPGPRAGKTSLEERADVVIAGGGDGSIRGRGLKASRHPGADGRAPAGHGNLLARNLGLEPERLQANINVALHG